MTQSNSNSIPGRAVFAALFVASLGMLMYEILQTITLSLQTLERNAFLVVSMCLLGLGGGGSIAALVNRRTTWSGSGVMWWSAMLFGVAIAATSIVSSWTNNLYALIALGVTPYLPAGVFLATVFQQWPTHANRLYFVNLIGSGLGCLLLILVVNGSGDALTSILAVASLPLAAASLIGSTGDRRLVVAPIVAAVVILALIPARHALYRFSPAPTKGMAMIVNDPAIGAETQWSRWGYLGRLDVVRAGKGIGRFRLGGREVQKLIDSGCDVSFLFASGGNWTKAVRFPPGRDLRPAYVKQTLHSLAYKLTENPDVLNIGFGGGVDIFLSLWHNAKSVVGVDINPLMVKAGRDALAGYYDDFYNDPRVEIHVMDGRTYARNARRKFDVISLTAVDTGELLHSNAHVLLENYLYTQEAFDDYLRILKPDGYLYVSRPHIQSMRAMMTATKSLRKLGVSNPAEHFAVLGRGEVRRGRWRNVLISRKPLTEPQKRQLVSYFRPHVAYMPGYKGGDRSYFDFFAAVAAGKEDAYAARQKLDFSPVHDDRPFFYEFSRDYRHSFAAGVLTGILKWTAGIAALLILIPLMFLPIEGPKRASSLLLLALYFAAIGLGFMVVEICLIQKLVLFLGHPSYSVTVTLFSILVFSGFGSVFSSRFDPSSRRTPLLIWGPILLAVGLYGLGMDQLLHTNHTDALWVRIVMTVVFLAPGSFFMGMPFPTMIRTMTRDEQALIPWAWAVNAFMSVIASSAAVYFAMQIGFHKVLLIGLAAYLLSMLVFVSRSALFGRQTPASGS